MKTNNVVKGEMYVMGLDTVAEGWMTSLNWKNKILGLPEIKEGDAVTEVYIHDTENPNTLSWSERATDATLDKENAVIYGNWPEVMAVSAVKRLKVGDILKLKASNGTVIELTVKRARKPLAHRGYMAGLEEKRLMNEI